MKLLLDDQGISPEIRRAFVVYLAEHGRPMSELLAPTLRDIERLYREQFIGMTRLKVLLADLVRVQRTLANTLVRALDDDEKEFLLSMKRGEPEWHRLGIEHLSQLPGIQWKLINIRKMDSGKRKAALDRLIRILAT